MQKPIKCQDCHQNIKVKYDVSPNDDEIKRKLMDLTDSFVYLPKKGNFTSTYEYSALEQQTNQALKIEELKDQKTVELKYPVCLNCFDRILLEMQKKRELLEDKKNKYAETLKQIENEIAEKEKNLVDRQKEEERLLSEEEKLDKKLEEMLELERLYDSQIDELTVEEKKLHKEEKSFWKDVNDFEMNLIDFEEERNKDHRKICNIKEEVKKLSQTNVLNDIFKISMQSEYAIINGLRFGKLNVATEKVGWDEINAAIGQTVLLLCCLSKRFNYNFKQHDLHPLGNFSKISNKNMKEKEKFELFMPSNENRFNYALVQLLDCTRDMCDYVQKTFTFLEKNRVPYAIIGDTIGQYSIKYNSARLEDWTKACKYFLTNIKWLVFASAWKDMMEQKSSNIRT